MSSFLPISSHFARYSGSSCSLRKCSCIARLISASFSSLISIERVLRSDVFPHCTPCRIALQGRIGGVSVPYRVRDILPALARGAQEHAGQAVLDDLIQLVRRAVPRDRPLRRRLHDVRQHFLQTLGQHIRRQGVDPRRRDPDPDRAGDLPQGRAPVADGGGERFLTPFLPFVLPKGRNGFRLP